MNALLQLLLAQKLISGKCVQYKNNLLKGDADPLKLKIIPHASMHKLTHPTKAPPTYLDTYNITMQIYPIPLNKNLEKPRRQYIKYCGNPSQNKSVGMGAILSFIGHPYNLII